MKKKTILNSLMILIIILIAVSGWMTLKALKGPAVSVDPEKSDLQLSIIEKSGINTVERSGIAYEVEKSTEVRIGDRFRSKKAAIAALNKHYGGKKLLPKVFKDQNRIKEVKGLYVPVWLFDGDADADVQYEATKVRRWSDSEYNYTETRHYAVIRSGGIGFENVPVDGSTKMDDTLMESIEPYDLSAAVDFQTAYLSGYLADKYDVDADQSIARANERIKRSTEEAFRSTVHGYTSVTTVDSAVNLQNGKARYALYPVWILNTDWNGQKFTFGINGQTGKVAGDLPMDKGKFWTWLVGVSGAVTAAAFAISYLMWL